MLAPSASHLPAPAGLPCFCPVCYFWLLGVLEYREHCRGSRHSKRLRSVCGVTREAPAWLVGLCRDALWVVYV
eukprot:3741211-Lingulodinium_polyedra.AAC.1